VHINVRACILVASTSLRACGERQQVQACAKGRLQGYALARNTTGLLVPARVLTARSSIANSWRQSMSRRVPHTSPVRPPLQVIKDMEKFWQKQFDQNYSRSLDHRSFYFKSIDKKILGNRHVVGELKDAAEANAARPEAALAVHAALPAAIRLRPDITLDLPLKCARRSRRAFPDCVSLGPVFLRGELLETKQSAAQSSVPRRLTIVSFCDMPPRV
jgi:hypothetical protein